MCFHVLKINCFGEEMINLKTIGSCLVLGVMCFGSVVEAEVNLLRNGSFEDVPNGDVGQAIMPSDWVAAYQTPDTYSNDGSYGLAPSGLVILRVLRHRMG